MKKELHRWCYTKGTSAVSNIVSFISRAWALFNCHVFCCCRDEKWSDRKSLMAQTLRTACFKVRTRWVTVSPQTSDILPLLWTNSLHIIDAHVNIVEDFLRDAIHNISLMTTGFLPRQGGDKVKGGNYNGLTTTLFSQSANSLIRHFFDHLAFTLAFIKVVSSRNNCL